MTMIGRLLEIWTNLTTLPEVRARALFVEYIVGEYSTVADIHELFELNDMHLFRPEPTDTVEEAAKGFVDAAEFSGKMRHYGGADFWRNLLNKRPHSRDRLRPIVNIYSL